MSLKRIMRVRGSRTCSEVALLARSVISPLQNISSAKKKIVKSVKQRARSHGERWSLL